MKAVRRSEKLQELKNNIQVTNKKALNLYKQSVAVSIEEAAQAGKF